MITCSHHVRSYLRDPGVNIQQPSVDVEVKWNRFGLIEVCWSGRVAGAQVFEALEQGKMLLGDKELTALVVDTKNVSGYELSVRIPSIQFLRFFQSRGLQEIVAVMPNSLVSLFAATMRLVTKVRFTIFQTRMEAMGYLAGKYQPTAQSRE